MGHFIEHLAGSEPRTHHGVGKQLFVRAPEGLGGAPTSGGGWRGECSGVGRCTGVGVEEEERGAGNGGAGRSGRVRGERWCPSAWGGSLPAWGEGLAWG